MSRSLLTLSDDWRVEMDERNFVLTKRNINEKTGEEQYKPHGFYTSLDGVLREAMRQDVVAEGEAEGVQDLIDRIERIAEKYGRIKLRSKLAPKVEPLPVLAPKPVKGKKKRQPSRAAP